MPPIGRTRDLSPPKCLIYLRSFFRIGFLVSSPIAWSRRPRIKFLFVTWRVLARRCPATILCWLTDHLRRLPPHGLSPPRSCPRLVLSSYELSIWYDDSLFEETGTKYRGLSPHKITPMLGVLHRSRACAVSQMDNQPSRPGDGYRYPTQISGLNVRTLTVLALISFSVICFGEEASPVVDYTISAATEWPAALAIISRHSLKELHEYQQYEFHPEKPVHVTHTQYFVDKGVSLVIEHDYNERIRSIRLLLPFTPRDGHPDCVSLTLESVLLRPGENIAFQVRPGRIDAAESRFPNERMSESK
ncbi:cyclophilin [Rhodopirellula europaea SH398]|uniref:Cyclophilin n=1 Tax=Rhodopirellula europaea SH398 TaxID=1263868 RepID=M5SE03_9BACT|nr:cyclophilin [Rhodopirellula europaea SH398]